MFAADRRREWQASGGAAIQDLVKFTISWVTVSYFGDETVTNRMIQRDKDETETYAQAYRDKQEIGKEIDTDRLVPTEIASRGKSIPMSRKSCYILSF